MAIIQLIAIFVSLTTSSGAVPVDPKLNHTKLEKFPVPVTETSNELNEEYSVAPKCNLTITGPWSEKFNFTVTPVPPRVDDFLKLNIGIYAYNDMWFMRAKGNLGRKSAGQGYSFDVNVCDYKLGLCPMREGETKHVDWQLYLPSAYVDKGIYDGYAEVLDQGTKNLLVVTVQNCVVV